MTLRPLPSSKSGLRLSLFLHTVLASAFLYTLSNQHAYRRVHSPGTSKGTLTMLNYNNGGHVLSNIGIQASSNHPRHPPSPAPMIRLNIPTRIPEYGTSAQGSGSSVNSALGEGNIKIALPLIFPKPEPDLTSLQAHDGEVIIDVTIDNVGKLVKLSLIQGLGPSIDPVVLAGVKTWRYAPATLNGAPVESEQELIFYYKH